MSNPFYTNNFTGTAGQTARAEDVDTQFSGIQSGFDIANADVIRSLKGQPSEVMNALAAAVIRANKWLRFDPSGQPLLVAAPFNFKGNWLSSTSYNTGDVVNAAPNSSLYICTSSFTSGVTFNVSNWDLFIDLQGLFLAKYQIVTGPTTFMAATGQSLFLDSTSGDIIVTLPAGNLGDSPVNITYVGGSLTSGQTQIIQSAPGQYIQGTTETQLNINVNPMSITLAYAGPSYGWILRTMG